MLLYVYGLLLLLILFEGWERGIAIADLEHQVNDHQTLLDTLTPASEH